MKILTIIIILICFVRCTTQEDSSLTRSILLEELRNNHTTKDWYVPLGIAITGLTEEQANWKDSTTEHSIKELASHLAFWNERVLIDFKGDTLPNFDGNNEATFRKYESLNWQVAVIKIDSIQVEWERAVESAHQQQLENGGAEIASMSAHNAYHTGQIVLLRKQNGWWDESQGVK